MNYFSNYTTRLTLTWVGCYEIMAYRRVIFWQVRWLAPQKPRELLPWLLFETVADDFCWLTWLGALSLRTESKILYLPYPALFSLTRWFPAGVPCPNPFPNYAFLEGNTLLELKRVRRFLIEIFLVWSYQLACASFPIFNDCFWNENLNLPWLYYECEIFYSFVAT